MSIEIKVPSLGESITEATVSKWMKKEGESFQVDEPLVEIETEKITLEVSAPTSGTLEKIKANEGIDVKVGGILGLINETSITDNKEKINENKIISKEEKQTTNENSINKNKHKIDKNFDFESKLSPSAKKIIQENNIDVEKIIISREDGRITKEDVIKYLDNINLKEINRKIKKDKSKLEEIVKMSNIRKTIAYRLKEAQNTAAILTTFNEVDMSEIIKVRKLKKDSFNENYGVKLGYMSFFVKAVLSALKEFPAVNAEIKDENIIYKNYYHVGIAVGTENGLVVPIIKNADELNFGEIEKKIIELSVKAREGKLTMPDLSDGTFTISNGGIYGSMLSTPILNSPQSGILGMHNIQKRAVVIDDKIEIRPMMYLAFSYDHRIIDGKEAVTFLVKVKESLENPSKIILGI